MKKTISIVVIAGLLSAALVLLWARVENEREPGAAGKDTTKVILITMDTMRYDYLGCFGYDRNTSPNLDRLASQGVKFVNCYTSMPTTDPSHVSILTGAYPRTHGVIKNGMAVSNPKVLCIAEWFKKKGFATGAITARALTNPERLGLKGFDFSSAPALFDPSKKAVEIYEEAVGFIKSHVDEDFFLWVHFFDAHTPYEPPAPYDSMFNGEFKGYIEKPARFLPESVRWTDSEIAYQVSLYDGEIRYMDHYIGELINFLEEKFSEHSVEPFITVVADHGECLGELQGRFGFIFGHGKFLYDYPTKVPLIMSWKDKLPQGKVSDSLIESIDIAPTIIDLMGDKKPAQLAGISFSRAVFQDSIEHKRLAFVQRRIFKMPPKPYLAFDEFAVISQKYKLIENQVKGIELFDLTADESEEHNLAAAEPDVAEKLRGELRRWQKEYPQFKSDHVIPEKEIKVLKSLGYLQ
jgi:arylsulfatase A-like enzyme